MFENQSYGENYLKKSWEKCATAADKQVVALKAKLAVANAAHVRLDDIFVRYDADAVENRTELKGTKVRFGMVGQETRLTSVTLNEVREQSVKLAKFVEEASRQPTTVSSRAQYFEGDVNSLKFQMGKCIKARNDAMSSATEQRRHSSMLET